MEIQVNKIHATGEPVPERTEIEEHLEQALARFADRITRVEVHFKDINGPKQGLDKQCTIEARIAGLKPMAVTAEGVSVRQALHEATDKLVKLITRDLGKRSEFR